MMRTFCFLFVLISFLSKAQVSMEDFLLEALNEPTIKSFANQNTYLNTKPFRLAPIRQLQFRTESNQLDPERQDYSLRLSPANPWEIKRNNEYFKSYQELLQLDRERLLKESLMTRYETIIDWMYYQEVRDLKEEDKKITEKMLGILEGQRFSGFFDADDYVELKMDQIDKAIELEETHFEIDNQRRRVEALYEQARLHAIEWPVTSVMSIERLEAVIDSLSIQKGSGGEVAYREKQIDLANHEWQLEKNNINIGYLQAQYQQYREEQGRKPWNIALGVTIPIFNPNKGDMAKRKLDVIEAEGKFDQAKLEQLEGRELVYRKIKSLVKRHNEINSMMQEINVGALAATLQQIKGNNPIAIIRMQSNLIKLKNMAARLKKEIYLSYVEFLGYSEFLQQTPLINYLSPTLKPLE